MLPIRDDKQHKSLPIVTLLLIVSCVFVFYLQWQGGQVGFEDFITDHALTPSNFQFSDLVSSIFMHGSIPHLIGNLWFLWIFGDNVEHHLGKIKFLLFYILSGFLASFAQIFFSIGSDVPMLGASGAIAGVMGYYLLKFPKNNIKTLIPLGVLTRTIDLPAIVIIGQWFVLQFFSGVGSLASTTDSGGVAWWAHIGGFFGGMLLSKIFR